MTSEIVYVDEKEAQFHRGKNRTDLPWKLQHIGYGLRNHKEYAHVVDNPGTSFAKLHGCRGNCPYYGTKQCLYGVGKKKYEVDVVLKGTDELIKPADSIMLSVATGVCQERKGEVAAIFHSTTNLNGLRMLSAQSFFDMAEQIKRLCAERDRIVELRRSSVVQINGNAIDATTADADIVKTDYKLLEIDKEIAVLQSKYHDKLDMAIANQTKIELSREERHRTELPVLDIPKIREQILQTLQKKPLRPIDSSPDVSGGNDETTTH